MIASCAGRMEDPDHAPQLAILEAGEEIRFLRFLNSLFICYFIDSMDFWIMGRMEQSGVRMCRIYVPMLC